MSRRRNRTLTKAQKFGAGNSPATTGTTWTADQVAAVLRATVASAGGQAAMPLPRLETLPPFGPGIPLVPAPINALRPDSGRAEPRAYEYPVAWNLPGFGERLVPWKVLRDAADMIPLFRRCIEIRKAEVATLDWDVVISAKAVERAQRQDPGSARADVEKAMRERVDPHIGRLVDFFEQPDPRNGHDFIAWASKVLEEYFVLDAIPIYPRMRRNGDLYGFEVLDGTTIKPLLDADGFRPLAPQPAFQQILYGFPRGEFTADGEPDPDTGALPGAYPSDRLVYKVHNVRSWTPYGLSAVEQALTDGELYLRRLGWLKSEYTDGVMPAGWLKAGLGQAEWSPQQLSEYERQFNDYYAGNTIARQRFRILPYGMEPDDSRTDLGERYKPEYDLHLIKLVASHFDTTIAELGFTETGGLGSTGWHEGQADVQDRKATQPTLRRLQSLCTHLMRTYLNAPPELEFRVLGLESEDEDAADEVANRRIGSARMTLNEDRDRTGLARYTFPEADMPMLITQRGIVFMEGASELAEAGQMVSPAMGVPIGTEDPNQPGAEGEPPVPGQPAPPAPAKPAPGKAGPAKPDAAAVKAELVAYRRWLAKGKTSRAFRFETITKADAAAAGVDLAHAEFLTKAGGDPGTAPKVRHWPGWERDLAVAEHWAPLVHQALTGAVSAQRLAADFLALHAAAGVGSARSWLGTQHLPIAERLQPVLAGLWTDGYVVGAISSRTVLAHHGIIAKAEQTITMGADWGSWTPGDETAAREVLGAEGLGEGLAGLLEHGGVIIQGIEATKLDQLAELLARGLAAGDAPATIATAIRALVDNPRWAYTVAVTETTRAVSSATLLRYSRNGVDAKEWYSAGDQHVCSPCNVNEDTGAIPLDSYFPDGNDAPPGHPLCRCSLGPAWITAEEAAASGYDVPVLPEFGAAEDLATRTAGEILAEVEPEAVAAEVPETAAADAIAAAEQHARDISEGLPGVRIEDELVRQAGLTPRSMQQLDAVHLPEPGTFDGDAYLAMDHGSAFAYYTELGSNPSVYGTAAAATDTPAPAIWFSPHWHGGSMGGRVGKAVESGWFGPSGASTPLARITAHEYGHHVADVLFEAVNFNGTADMPGEIALRFLTVVNDQIGGDRYWAHARNGDLLEPVHWGGGNDLHYSASGDLMDTWVFQNKDLIVEKVSGYAAKNFQEFLAEIWQEYSTMGAEARPHIKVIGDLMRQLAEELRA